MQFFLDAFCKYHIITKETTTPIFFENLVVLKEKMNAIENLAVLDAEVHQSKKKWMDSGYMNELLSKGKDFQTVFLRGAEEGEGWRTIWQEAHASFEQYYNIKRKDRDVDEIATDKPDDI